jgi:hypothetical protein
MTGNRGELARDLEREEERKKSTHKISAIGG